MHISCIYFVRGFMEYIVDIS